MSLTDEFDQQLPPRGRALIKRAREFAEEAVRPAVRRPGGWAGATIRAACAAGLAGIEIPEACGGDGLPYAVRVRVAEELARIDFPFAFALINHHNAAARIAAHGAAAAKERFLPPMLAGEIIGCTAMSEDRAGSDFAAIATVARPGADGWRLTGAKRWIANAAGADVLLTFAQTDLTDRGRDGIACFIVDSRAAGFTRNPAESLSALIAAGIGGFSLHDCPVPDAHVLYRPGEGFAQAMAGVNKARGHVAAMACGMVAASLDAALRHARTRETFGRPLVEHQGLRWSLADVATVLEALRLLTYRAARLTDERPDAAHAATQAAAMAKKYAAEQAMLAIAACAQAMGALGISDDSVTARHLMAAPALGIADGTTEMMNERIAALIVRPSREE